MQPLYMQPFEGENSLCDFKSLFKTTGNWRDKLSYFGVLYWTVGFWCVLLSTFGNVHKPLAFQTVRVWRRPSEFDMTKRHIALYSPTSLLNYYIDRLSYFLKLYVTVEYLKLEHVITSNKCLQDMD